MSHLFSDIIADISNMPWVAIIAVSGSLLLTIVVIVGGLLFANRRQQLWHETARLALEKGQPLPAMTDEVKASPRSAGDSSTRDLRAGLICLGVGAGLFLFFDAFLGRGMAYVGAIPGFIGLALVLTAFLSRLFKDKTPPPADRS